MHSVDYFSLLFLSLKWYSPLSLGGLFHIWTYTYDWCYCMLVWPYAVNWREKSTLGVSLHWKLSWILLKTFFFQNLAIQSFFEGEIFVLWIHTNLGSLMSGWFLEVNTKNTISGLAKNDRTRESPVRDAVSHWLAGMVRSFWLPQYAQQCQLRKMLPCF